MKVIYLAIFFFVFTSLVYDFFNQFSSKDIINFMFPYESHESILSALYDFEYAAGRCKRLKRVRSCIITISSLKHAGMSEPGIRNILGR
jgi:hypothetical protein